MERARLIWSTRHESAAKQLSMISVYLRRLAVMLFLAMPLTALGLAVAMGVDRSGVSEGIVSRFIEYLGFIFVWGGLTAIPLSLLHTALTRTKWMDRSAATICGAILGAVVGACTPTAFTGLMNPQAVVIGTVVGVLYGLLVSSLALTRVR